MPPVNVILEGDPCPNCGGDLRELAQPTDKMRAAADPRNPEPIPIPPQYDSASGDFVEEHGPLHRCRDCGYQARFRGELVDKERARRRAQSPAASSQARVD
jgi:hypothetical protein